jgi:carboxypeptidase Taq
MEEKLNKLKSRLQEIYDIDCAGSVLSWDQNTYMPPGGGPARARQLALLRRLSHEKFSSPEIGKLLDDLQSYEESRPYDSDEASLIRVTRRKYEKAVKVPPSFTAEMARHGASSRNTWVKARPKNDFSMVESYLEKSLELRRQLADYFPGYVHVMDPLIDYSDYGMKVSDIKPLFGELKKELVPLVEKIASQEPPDDSCARQHFPEEKQLILGLEVA